MKCECPLNCRYCGRRRSQDSVGHYCKTNNCQWRLGYSTCRLPKEKLVKGKLMYVEINYPGLDGRGPDITYKKKGAL